MNKTIITALTAMLLLGCNQNKNMSTLNLTDEWDKMENFFKENLR